MMTGKGISVNRDDALSTMLLQLRSHFGTCRVCKAAIKTGGYDMLCPFTKWRIVSIAARWDASITIRLTAKRSDHAMAYPCPNLKAHGDAYALTAEPLYVTAIQDRLF